MASNAPPTSSTPGIPLKVAAAPSAGAKPTAAPAPSAPAKPAPAAAPAAATATPAGATKTPDAAEKPIQLSSESSVKYSEYFFGILSAIYNNLPAMPATNHQPISGNGATSGSSKTPPPSTSSTTGSAVDKKEPAKPTYGADRSSNISIDQITTESDDFMPSLFKSVRGSKWPSLNTSTAPAPVAGPDNFQKPKNADNLARPHDARYDTLLMTPTEDQVFLKNAAKAAAEKKQKEQQAEADHYEALPDLEATASQDGSKPAATDPKNAKPTTPNDNKKTAIPVKK